MTKRSWVEDISIDLSDRPSKATSPVRTPVLVLSLIEVEISCTVPKIAPSFTLTNVVPMHAMVAVAKEVSWQHG